MSTEGILVNLGREHIIVKERGRTEPGQTITSKGNEWWMSLKGEART